MHENVRLETMKLLEENIRETLKTSIETISFWIRLQKQK
jgi:hypothetical protein